MVNRLSKLHAEMAAKNLDAVYVTSTENHHYMSGYNNPDGWMVITKNKSYLFADFRYIESAKKETASCYEVIMPKGGIKEYLVPLLKDNDVKTIGYEDRNMTCSQFEGLKSALDEFEFSSVGSMFTDIRSIKTRDEVDKIVRAQRIAEIAFDHILKFIKYDMTEVEIALELEYVMRKNGADDKSFDTICVSGSASSLPHGVPRKQKLEKGFLTMDYGALVDGYHSDMTRTVMIGTPDEDMKKLYNTVLEAQLAAIDLASEGVKNADLDKTARSIIDNAGYEGKFGHSLGHGVGMQIHESPGVSGGMGETTLQPGQIITIEPGIYIEGKYGCRIEDMLHITPGGKENLTKSPKELIII
jgi:Xaa-Pro aminopeptidase